MASGGDGRPELSPPKLHIPHRTPWTEGHVAYVNVNPVQRTAVIPFTMEADEEAITPTLEELGGFGLTVGHPVHRYPVPNAAFIAALSAH